jgi:hypothetical protein
MSNENSFTSLTSIVEHIHDLAEDADNLHVDDILDMIGSRSFGPLMVVPALMAVIPFIGAIPGMTIITGLAIMAIACQILLGRSRVWVPKKVRDIPLDLAALKKGANGFEGTAKFIDKFMTYRFAWATRGIGLWVTALVMVILGFVMLPTALLPWAVLVPGMAALILALGITARDGLVVVVGWLLASGAVYAVYLFAASSDSIAVSL